MQKNPENYSQGEYSSFSHDLQYHLSPLEKSTQQRTSLSAHSTTYSDPYKARCVAVARDKYSSSESKSTAEAVQFVPLNMAESHSAISQFQERSRLISLHLSEIVEELTTRTNSLGEEESFPEMEEFAEEHVEVGSDFSACRLCGRLVAGAPRWHFEGTHYEEFLRWLEVRARAEARRRLVHHRRNRTKAV